MKRPNIQLLKIIKNDVSDLRRSAGGMTLSTGGSYRSIGAFCYLQEAGFLSIRGFYSEGSCCVHRSYPLTHFRQEGFLMSSNSLVNYYTFNPSIITIATHSCLIPTCPFRKTYMSEVGKWVSCKAQWGCGSFCALGVKTKRS